MKTGTLYVARSLLFFLIELLVKYSKLGVLKSSFLLKVGTKSKVRMKKIHKKKKRGSNWI
jgi:hypothetical protein